MAEELTYRWVERAGLDTGFQVPADFLVSARVRLANCTCYAVFSATRMFLRFHQRRRSIIQSPNASVTLAKWLLAFRVTIFRLGYSAAMLLSGRMVTLYL